MKLTRLLIANRGEIAIRIARAAAELEIPTVAVFSEDDAAALHIRRADVARGLPGVGAAAYLNIDAVIEAALETGCDSVHPGYGLLSENAIFAGRCEQAGLRFVGPSPDTLELFGDKAQARAHAAALGVPLARATSGDATPAEMHDFARGLPPGTAIMIKAIAGGGGRGMRMVADPAGIDEAYARCRSEAIASFGNGALYAEELVENARHVEVQILGDGGEVSHLWERECSIQRRHQKLIEVAPCAALSPGLRRRVIDASVRMAEAAGYRSLGTFEFLVQPDRDRFVFMEANPRLQVEHTVTEAITGLDLVAIQLRIAGGATLADLRLRQQAIPVPQGAVLQLRVNMERMDAAGETWPSAGTLTAYEPPAGRGVRVDGFGYTGYPTNPRFDSLLAKVITHAATPEDAAARAYRALCEFRVEGVETNIPLLQAILCHPDYRAGQIDTRFVETRIAALAAATTVHPKRFFDEIAGEVGSAAVETAPAGQTELAAPMDGLVVAVKVVEGEAVAVGQTLVVLEAMKLEVAVAAAASGIARRVLATPGALVARGAPLLFIDPGGVDEVAVATEPPVDPAFIRPDLAESIAAHRVTLDEARPAAVARRRKTGQITAREGVAALCDPGSFREYGALVLAGQRARRSLDELIEISPADGIVAGIGTINASTAARWKSAVVLAYDYTVFAGTQGWMGHAKMDRMFGLARESNLPVIIFTEGGGGRPGETDHQGVGLQTDTFRSFGRLNGQVPLVAINSGRCFAGNAALLGCCDVVIATAASSIGMAGPAMIEGGGLGVFTPEEIGPTATQSANGVVDLVARDDAEAITLARRYLSYFQGVQTEWDCADQQTLRHMIPENRRRAYDVRAVLHGLADRDAVLELRAGFGRCMLTAFVRVAGRPIGVIANDPMHLAGAIDGDGADKAARFMQLCDAFDIPVLSLCDTPGFMVGPEAERSALVRHVSRMFITGANISVPILTIVLRRGYGLGSLAMSGGSFHASLFTVSWPTGEFGGMGLEGAVRLAYRREFAAEPDPAARNALYEAKVAELYERGKAMSAARFLEIDDVIDPAASRDWITQALDAAPVPEPRLGRRRRHVDSW